MSTLKKVLALTLALAMILSVSAFAGSYKADTYKDAASIDKDCEDSIELLYALDIMQGDAQGNFRPNDTITRAEVAKMIYVIKNYGKDDKAVTYQDAKIFSDVPATAWYAGYVNYCGVTKLIQGRGNGTFGPNDPVTTAAAAKMLLTATMPRLAATPAPTGTRTSCLTLPSLACWTTTTTPPSAMLPVSGSRSCSLTL